MYTQTDVQANLSTPNKAVEAGTGTECVVQVDSHPIDHPSNPVGKWDNEYSYDIWAAPDLEREAYFIDYDDFRQLENFHVYTRQRRELMPQFFNCKAKEIYIGTAGGYVTLLFTEELVKKIPEGIIGLTKRLKDAQSFSA